MAGPTVEQELAELKTEASQGLLTTFVPWAVAYIGEQIGEVVSYDDSLNKRVGNKFVVCLVKWIRAGFKRRRKR